MADYFGCAGRDAFFVGFLTVFSRGDGGECCGEEDEGGTHGCGVVLDVDLGD